MFTFVPKTEQYPNIMRTILRFNDCSKQKKSSKMIKRILKSIIIATLSPLCVIAQGNISFEKALADLEAQEDSVYYSYFTLSRNDTTQGRIREKRVIDAATNEQLDSLALNAKIPAIRLLAYETLLYRDAKKCISLLPKLIKDKSKVYRISPKKKAIIVQNYITEMSMSTLRIDSFDSISIEIIDSVVLANNLHPIGHPEETMEYYEEALNRCSGKPKFYNLFCDLYAKGDCSMLPNIAVYKKEQDLNKIKEVLKGYRLPLDEIDNDIEGEVLADDVCYYSGLGAVIEWPHKDFIPIFEEIAKYMFSRKGVYNTTAEFFFLSVLAYDNDWAYNLIDHYLKNKKLRKYYSRIFTRAFKKLGQKERFMPLIEKYGDKEILYYDGPYD